jgi:hypothetical protein
MQDAPATSRSAFDWPASYRITVEGRIPTKWCDRMEGMAATLWTSETGSHQTRLYGTLADQASLAGVLNTLYELHLVVISVERFG